MTLRMGLFGLRNRKMYFDKRPGAVDFGMSEYMSHNTWELVWRNMVLPKPPPPVNDNTNAPFAAPGLITSQDPEGAGNNTTPVHLNPDVV